MRKKTTNLSKDQNEKLMPLDGMPDLLTIRDVTHILNVHPNTLRNWERQGLIQVVRLGRRKDRRYKKEIIQKFLDDNHV